MSLITDLKGAIDNVDDLMTPSALSASLAMGDKANQISVDAYRGPLDTLYYDGGNIDADQYNKINGVLDQVQAVGDGLNDCGAFATGLIEDAVSNFAANSGIMEMANSIQQMMGEFDDEIDCISGFATLAKGEGFINDALGLGDLDRVADSLNGLLGQFTPDNIGQLIANTDMIQDLISPFDAFCDDLRAKFEAAFGDDLARLLGAANLIAKYAALAKILSNDPCRLVTDQGIFDRITTPVLNDLRGLWDDAHQPSALVTGIEEFLEAPIDAIGEFIGGFIPDFGATPKGGVLTALETNQKNGITAMMPKSATEIGAFATQLTGKLDHGIFGLPEMPKGVFGTNLSTENPFFSKPVQEMDDSFTEMALDELAYDDVLDFGKDDMALEELLYDVPPVTGDVVTRVKDNIAISEITSKAVKGIEAFVGGIIDDLTMLDIAKESSVAASKITNDVTSATGSNAEFSQFTMVEFIEDEEEVTDGLESTIQDFTKSIDKVFMSGGEVNSAMAELASAASSFSKRAEPVAKTYARQMNDILEGSEVHDSMDYIKANLNTFMSQAKGGSSSLMKQFNDKLRLEKGITPESLFAQLDPGDIFDKLGLTPANMQSAVNSMNDAAKDAVPEMMKVLNATPGTVLEFCHCSGGFGNSESTCTGSWVCEERMVGNEGIFGTTVSMEGLQ